MSRRRLALAVTAVIGWAMVSGASVATAATLQVPRQFSTIQSAVDAARPGDTIRVAAGTFVEQVSIGKRLALIGAGAGATVIRAPAHLVPGETETSAIVTVRDAASVAISRLTVSGPGAGTCEDGPLRDGILVVGNAHLDLSFAAVRHIHDTPLFNCERSGHGVSVGFPFFSNGTARISNVTVSDYAQVGIIAFNEGSTAEVTYSVVTGAGPSTVVANSGVEFVLGAVGVVTHSVISGNACGSPDLCGPDFFNEFQMAGISAGGAGTVIAHNVLVGNQVGIYVADAADVHHNLLVGNDYFGVALQDGSFELRDNLVTGGTGGVAVIAAAADTTAVIRRVTIVGTSGPAVQEFECCGFTATVTRSR